MVVGPVGSKTSEYKTSAKYYASLARSYGASVTEIYSPYATWSKVKAAAQGANLLIYLGHGNGYPSPYGAFQRYTKDGMGLNASYGNGNSNVKYWGEYYIDRDIQMAKNAVVILNRLCYASGNSEWGSRQPDEVDRDEARRQLRCRVPAGGCQGRLRRGDLERVVHDPVAVQVVADDELDLHEPSLRQRRTRLLLQVRRTSWARVHMDPPKAGKYWRSLIGNLALTSTQWRAGG